MSLVTRLRRLRKLRPTGQLSARVVTVAAALLVLIALLLPNKLTALGAGTFLRLPVEALLGAALVLVLPRRTGRVVVVLAGVGLGLLSVVKLVDMGFYAILSRRFDPVVDWEMFRFAVEVLAGSVGRWGAVALAVAAGALAIALLVLMPLAMLRLARLTVRHDVRASRAVAALGVVAVGCAALGVQLVPDRTTAAMAYDRTRLLYTSAQDQRAFAAEAAVDAYRDTPGDQLLTALRGKDVIVAFVESYGRDAVEKPEFAGVGALLDERQRRLAAQGYAARSGFLTSPTVGGNSWLAHSTLLSGVWINNQGRYRKLVDSDRLTLNGAFSRAGWRTVGVMPLVVRDWPEGEFYGYDELYDARRLDFHGPHFAMGTLPDQYTMSAFQRMEYGRADRPPTMVELALVSSHGPWAPLPTFIEDWDAVDDGPAFEAMAATAESPQEIVASDAKVRAAYGESIEYTLTTLLSWVETYAEDDLVLVMLGDHQPSPVVTGEDPSYDVPISILTKDPAVLERVAGWGWHDGLRPRPDAPVWRMETFRDRFLAAYGPSGSP